MNTPQLTLYYDGNCPLCRANTARLKRWDQEGKLAFVDIAEPGFDPAPLGVDLAELNREVYSRRADGAILVGIDTIVATHVLVGQGWRVLPLRVAVLRPLTAALYRLGARQRYRISRLFGHATPACADGVCHAPDHHFKG